MLIYIEVQRVAHAGIEQRGLRARQAHAAQQHVAFGQSAPSRHNREEFADRGRTAAAEHAAKCVEDVAAGGLDGASRQIGVARAADVLGESQSWIIGHHLHSTRRRSQAYEAPRGYSARAVCP